MTANIVNLRQYRKQKVRAERERTADENRFSFGRSKAEKRLAKALNQQAATVLDMGKLERQLPVEDKN
jgi:hypothetical protein